MQIIKHDFYRKAALSSQLKEYEIPAERGVIEVHDGKQIVPMVLNERLYTLFADPKFVGDAHGAADEIARIIGGNAAEYEAKMTLSTRYSILAKKLSKEHQQQLNKLNLKGIGTREELYRTYPQGQIAAQILGFVNDEGAGKYGVEQYMDEALKGHPGQLKAITDAAGVPLVSNSDNVIVDPVAGQRVVLTIDIAMQRQLEDILKAGLDAAKSKSGSAIIIDPSNGEVKAMANFPTFNPTEFYKVEDANIFNNAVVSSPLEVGSIMKSLTIAAGLDQGVISPESSYYDPGFFKVDDKTITNIVEVGGAAHRSIQDILSLSLNTGAVYVLRQMGGGELNEQARQRWHEYLTDHYRFGRQTGIEQGYEPEGFVPSPTEGYGLDIQYANTSFGQGLNISLLQMSAAFSSIVNGGTYYRPHLVEKLVNPDGKVEEKRPEALRKAVVSEGVSSKMREMLEKVAQRNNKPATRNGYHVGSKSGTAQIAAPNGGYYEDKYNGTYIGFVGGDMPKYVVVVRVNEPGIGGYAGARAAGPLFASITNMLMDNFGLDYGG